MEYTFCFESYGVPVRVESNSSEILDKAVDTITAALLERLTPIDCQIAQQTFSLPLLADGTCSIIQNGEQIANYEPEWIFWKFFNSLVRILVGEFASEHVFLHAGVVGWREKAIVLPGSSFYGKSTLVAELVKCGAEYYSDEYAILDENGLVHPFARPLTLRTDEVSVTEKETSVERIGGTKGERPLPVGCVLFTKYLPESMPDYQFLTTGQGVVEVIAQTIGIKRNTEFAINVLKNAFSNAIIVKSPRPEAGKFAPMFLEFVDNTAI
jgi:hypothetical protein